MSVPTDRQRQALDLYVNQKKPLREVAEILGVNYSSARRLIQRAMKWDNLDEKIKDHLRSRGWKEEEGLSSLHSGWLKSDTESLYFMVGQDDPLPIEDLAGMLREVFEDLTPAPKIQPPEHSHRGMVGVFAGGDFHVGARTEAIKGGVRFDREEALRRIRRGFSELYADMPECEEGLIIDNGDCTHANDSKDATPKSGNRLKVDGSYFENMKAFIEVADWRIQMALKKFDRVTYRANKGNHDPDAAVAINIALEQRYKENDRVKVVANDDDFFVYQKQDLFLAFHHGHGLKPRELAENLPYRFTAEFGRSKIHYLFTSHYHHDKADTFGGLRWRQLPSVCSLDDHGAMMGYADTAGLVAFLFDTRRGLKKELVYNFTIRRHG